MNLTKTSLPTLILALLATLAAFGTVGCATASRAQASSNQESIMEADGLLLGTPRQRNEALDSMKSLGVDSIRLLVVWSHLAPHAGSTRRPLFKGFDPGAYGAAFDPYDAVVKGARARGIQVIMTPTGPGPAWASRCSGSIAVRTSCKLSPFAFKEFMSALARRYSGHYGDVPRVTRWEIWNEPNVAIFLSPQFEMIRGHAQPTAAAQYRTFFNAATDALRANGHRSDQVMIGSVAPIGFIGGTLSRRPVASAYFLRSIFCLDTKLRRLTGSNASALGCSNFRRMTPTAISVHPYGRGGSRAPLASARTDEITMKTLNRVAPIVSAAGRNGRTTRRSLPLYLTELGFQTNPPDRHLGVSLTNQARYINQSDYLAWKFGSVNGISQYLLNDDRNISTGFQTGLRYYTGRAKPSLSAYRFPIWVVGSKHSISVWGQVRSARNGTPQRVRIQFRPSSGGSYRTVTTRAASTRGFISYRTGARSGSWRLQWTPTEGGATLTSRSMSPSPN